MTGEELRGRIDQLNLSYTEAALVLGLSYPGLQHQMRGERPVSRQTELLLDRFDELVALGRTLTPEQKQKVRRNASRKVAHPETARRMPERPK